MEATCTKLTVIQETMWDMDICIHITAPADTTTTAATATVKL